jgi:GT2 family glycosyltransferase
VKRVVRAVKDPRKTINILKKRYLGLSVDVALKELEAPKKDKKVDIKMPRVSIIVLTYNNVKHTKACLYSILKYSNYPNLELVIIDNNSKDETPAFLKVFKKKYGNTKFILNKTNKGFAGGCNQGVEAATGDYIIFLNNDTIVTPDWVNGLIKPLKNKNVGIVGPLTNFMWNHQEVEISYRSVESMLKKVADIKSKSGFREADDIAFFCVAARKEVIKEVGSLDEQFGVGMFEDDDYCLRVKKAGYKVAVAEAVFIHHFGQISLFSLGNEKYKEIFEENKKKFEKKWGIKWEKK